MFAFAFRRSLTLAPADSTTYYFGLDGLAPTVTVGAHRALRMPAASTVVAAEVVVNVGGTLGTTEDVPVNIYNVTQTSAVLIANGDWDQVERVHRNVALSIALAATDEFLIQFVTPAWVTNPTDVTIEVIVWLDDDAEIASIAAQDSGISDNLAAILTNDSDISAGLAARIANDSEISAAEAAILTNDSDISAGVVATTAAQSDANVNAAAILTNDSDISANLASIREGV